MSEGATERKPEKITPPFQNTEREPPISISPRGFSEKLLFSIALLLDQMRLALHISSKTAQKIADYRTQHGNYTSVDQLSQVVSKAIYTKIKDQVTV